MRQEGPITPSNRLWCQGKGGGGGVCCRLSHI